jgi:hypothetical protein
MDLNVYLIGGAIIIIAIIVLNHQKQKNKMQNFLQESGDTQPIFLLKAVEKKKKALSDLLYEDGVKPSASATPSTATGPKAALVKEFEKLEREYAAKKIALRTFDEHLFDLLEKAKNLPITT